MPYITVLLCALSLSFFKTLFFPVVQRVSLLGSLPLTRATLHLLLWLFFLC